MNTFCPFFKGNCKGNECVMFRESDCLIVSLLQGFFEGGPSSEEMERGGIEVGGVGYRNRESKAPGWLKSATPEELAVEMLEFKKKEFSEDENLGFHRISDFFWRSKGVEEYFLPYDVQLKIERANILAQKEVLKEEEMRHRERLEREREELPSLVGQCVDWAITNGLNRVTLADVDAYIMERDLEILKETRRALYAIANVKLKSK